MTKSARHRRRQAGFTLIELIVVIAVTGIIAGIVAVFIRTPIEGYMAVARRADLVTIADTALLRITRDVRAAVPNSVRVTQSGTTYYLEFLPMQNGGRYRESQDSTATCANAPDDNLTPGCNILDFTQNDHSFDVLGPPVDITDADYLVIYNLGIPGADVWDGDNLVKLNAASSTCTGNECTTLAFNAFQFPLESPNSRFYVASKPVSYICRPNPDGTGTITRITNYGDPTSTQPTPALSANDPRLAAKVSSCSFTYDAGASQRLGQLTLRIQLSQDGETVTLYREVAVNNDA